MTLEELKNGMREYFKKYKNLMTSEERKEFRGAILKVSITKAMSTEPSKEKSDYVVVIGDSYVIHLFGKTKEEARETYEQAVKDYKELPVTIYKSFSLYE